MDSPRLLVVEDDLRIAGLVCHVATEAGFQAHAATGPQDIIKAHDNVRPDVIVLDIVMPEMDGLEVLLFLRHKLSKARVVLISGGDGLSRKMTETMGTAWGLTIAANISKPFQIDEFRAVLEKIKSSLDGEQRLCEQNHGHHN